MQKSRNSIQISKKRPSPSSLFRAGRTVAEVARIVGCSERVILRWIMQVGWSGTEATEALDVDERTELLRLRAENTRLRVERDVFVKASARFVQETYDLLRPLIDSPGSKASTEDAVYDDVTVWLRGLA